MGAVRRRQRVRLPRAIGVERRGRNRWIIIDDVVASSDFNTYMQTFHIKRTGSFSVTKLGKAPTYPDTLEGSLDAETIGGLSPGANVIVYVIPSLSFTDMTDGFNWVVAKHKAALI